MKTVYIPAGATYNYETLVTDDVIVHGHLHVTNGLKAKHISGRVFLTAGEVSADIVDVTELECGTVICRRLLAQRVSCNEAMISESAAVSRFFSANYVKAPSLTVAVSEIGEADAEEIVHLTPKPRGMLLTLLFSKLRTFWLRLTASRPQGRFEKPRTEAPVEEPSDTPEDTEMKPISQKSCRRCLHSRRRKKPPARTMQMKRMILSFSAWLVRSSCCEAKATRCAFSPARRRKMHRSLTLRLRAFSLQREVTGWNRNCRRSPNAPFMPWNSFGRQQKPFCAAASAF